MLRKITETLAGELSQPSAHEPDWSELEWTVARAVAAMHGVSPLLARLLRWRGPERWSEFLQQQRAHTAARHRRIESLLQLIDERARAHGFAATALKGAALHKLGVYSAGERPMADLDLLVRPADAERAASMLVALGFNASVAGWKEQVFTPGGDQCSDELGEHACNPVKIELHRRICERLPWQITDLSTLMLPSDARPGLNDYPSRGSLMAHLLLHAAGSMTSQALRLVQLHDIALLCTGMTRSDWDVALAPRVGVEQAERRGAGQRGSREGPWWAAPPLRLAAMYYPRAVPVHVLRAMESRCPWLLTQSTRRKRLTDVSYSHLRIDAFPGIEWACSVREAARYAVRRVRPDAGQRAFREETVLTQTWARGVGWSSLSQGRRVLRWLLARPVRPVTLHSVNAALLQR